MAPPVTKRSAALASISSGVLLTALKLGVGIATGSLAILAEAAHSALDLLAALRPDRRLIAPALADLKQRIGKRDYELVQTIGKLLS